jgi:hypothetical protein
MRQVLLVLMLLMGRQVCAQQVAKDQPVDAPKRIWMFSAHLNGDKPIMDYGKRFGLCYKVGGSILQKNTKNFIAGVRMDFILGSNIKEDSVTWNWYNAAGFAIDNTGQPRNPGVFQRGYQVGIDVGKVLALGAANANSGLTWLSSYGFMQYRINIYDQDNGFPQFAGAYEKGYDRLTNGLYTEQFLGYAYFSTSKSVNFIAGLTFNYARTGGRRTWLYDVNRSGLDKRNDGTVGVKLMWMIPKYKKTVEETYY